MGKRQRAVRGSQDAFRLVPAFLLMALTACGGRGGGGGGSGGGGSGAGGGNSPIASATTAIELLNVFRDWAGLPDVTEDASLVPGVIAHATYIVKNDVLEHAEDPGNPWYTPAGHLAATQRNPYASFATTGYESPMIAWMTGPFHGIGIANGFAYAWGFSVSALARKPEVGAAESFHPASPGR